MFPNVEETTGPNVFRHTIAVAHDAVVDVVLSPARASDEVQRASPVGVTIEPEALVVVIVAVEDGINLILLAQGMKDIIHDVRAREIARGIYLVVHEQEYPAILLPERGESCLLS